MNVLITSSRMPFALAEIRHFGEQGHRVFATDTFETAPGSHSVAVTQHIRTASPRLETALFIKDLKRIVNEKRIDLVLPQFEEMFYIARHRDEFDDLTEIFIPPLETLVRFHDKAKFVILSNELSIPTPESTIAASEEELKAAINKYEQFFARAVYSRGGVTLFTNMGVLAGRVRLDECCPTKENPWIVQEFLDGIDLCSFSVVHHGKVSVHCTYQHPKTIEHAGGIQFISVDEPGTLDIVERFVDATGYNGQISFDYIKCDGILYMVECNPRPTEGVALMPSEMFVQGVLEETAETRVLQANRCAQIDVAIIRDMIHNWKAIPSDIRALINIPDVYLSKHDMLPAIYQFLSYSHIQAYRRFMHTFKHKRTDILAAQFYDICWNGEQIQ